MAKLVDFTKRGGIGIITVNNPPVNALSVGVPQGLIDALAAGEADAQVKAMVLVGGGRTFIAGADISEFFNPPKGEHPTIHDAIAALEGSAKIVVAGIHGTALGGGLEVAMACHYRCGVAAASFGQPEIKLGLLPGAGGTQRLPRLIGPERALPLIASGDSVPADRALEMGLIDLIVAGDVTSGAADFANKLVAEGKPLRRVRDLATPAPSSATFFADFEKSIAKRARGTLAPYKIIECVKAAVELPFDEGIARERALFRDCLDSEQARGLIHLFFAERTANKIPDVPRDTPKATIAKAAMIGAGTMGGGIAMNFLNAGIPVTIVETDQEALDHGLGVIRGNYEGTMRRGRITQADIDERMARLEPALDIAAVADADIVIEAVFEEMDLKKEVFARLDAV
jgi:3-hydroxyacyl-CoA dehydrogenase